MLGGVVVASPCHSSPSLCSPSKREDRLARDFTNSDRESGSKTTRTRLRSVSEWWVGGEGFIAKEGKGNG